MKRTIYLHRSMWKMEANVAHMAIGIAITVVLAVLLVVFAKQYWQMETLVVGKLLVFAGVPAKLFHIGTAVDPTRAFPVFYKPGGLTFQIPMRYTQVAPLVTIIISIVLVIVGLILYRTNRFPLPLKVVYFTITCLVIVTLMYVSFVSPVPPHFINRLTVDWQFSGILVLILAAGIFSWAIFPIKGSLGTKLGWLAALLIFSTVWNVVRLSVVLATLYYGGSLPFILLHYLAGIYVDFIYIIMFYSLAIGSLAKVNVSEVGW
jgi:exosortase/archaeosortase family protein